MSRRKDIATVRRLQDDYALSERRYEKSLAKRKRAPSSRRKVAPASHAKNEGRVEGFLAGACATAIAWLYSTRKSWAGA